MTEIEDRYEPILRLFFAGRMPRFNHARHLAVANILFHLPHGRELMHLGLQITATRAGVPEKYSRAVTDDYWAQLDGTLPDPGDFADVTNWLRCDRERSSSPAGSGER
jgi:hypothetical protein